MRKMILFSVGIAAFALSLDACRKNNDATPSVTATNNPANLVETMAKAKVDVKTRNGVYIQLGDMNMMDCIRHPTAVCYWITVSPSNPTHMIVMDGDITGNYTATPEYANEKFQLKINAPEGLRIVDVSEVTQTVDESGTSHVTYK